MPIVTPPTSNRTTPLPYYRLRADASQSFNALCVKKINRGTLYGITIGEPIAIPRQCPEIMVAWFENDRQSQVTLQRLELTGGSRVRRAMPSLSDTQRLFTCQEISFSDRRTWGRLDLFADKWWTLRLQVVDAIVQPNLREAMDAIKAPTLSPAQKLAIVNIHHSLNPDISPQAIGLHWAELADR